MSGDIFLSEYAYELCGFLNMFGVVPDFVYPVFLHRGKLYIQSGKKGWVDEFVKLRDSAKKYVIDINKIYLKYPGLDMWKQDTVNGGWVISRNVNEKALYGFQLSEEEFICGEAEYMLNFLTWRYVTHDPILKKEINDFQKELKRYRRNTKIADKRQKGARRVRRMEDRHDLPRVRLWMTQGTGKFTINGKAINCYFQDDELRAIVRPPIYARKLIRRYNIEVTVSGGTPRKQALAINAKLKEDLKKLRIIYRRGMKKCKEIPEHKYGIKAAKRNGVLKKPVSK